MEINLGSYVLIHIGTNGAHVPGQFPAICAVPRDYPPYGDSPHIFSRALEALVPFYSSISDTVICTSNPRLSLLPVPQNINRSESFSSEYGSATVDESLVATLPKLFSPIVLCTIWPNCATIPGTLFQRAYCVQTRWIYYINMIVMSLRDIPSVDVAGVPESSVLYTTDVPCQWGASPPLRSNSAKGLKKIVAKVHYRVPLPLPLRFQMTLLL